MISTKNMSLSQVNDIFKLTTEIKKTKNNIIKNNKILINAFFEPSTRTSLSFESAMYKLGGNVINFNQEISSLKKGESIYDTLKTLENYGDIIVIRHPDKHLIHDIYNANFLKIPIINGGNGAGEHPTQALLDLYTIYEKYNHNFENIKKLNILFIGDILNSRTVNSLIDLLHLFPKIKINILPYSNINNPTDDLLKDISKFHNQNINDIIINHNNINWKNFNVIYVTRIQKERYLNDVLLNTNNFNIDMNIVNEMNIDTMIMHPLPRNSEINSEIDNDERIYYFKQMNNGVYIRMAIINSLLP